MKALITTITRSPKGNPILATREVTADAIRVGRGAECEFRLADPRVPIHAKNITKGENGPQIVDATGQVQSGASERPLTLGPGTKLQIGPYALEVTDAPAGIDLALNVELVQPLPESTKLASQAIMTQARRLPISRRMLSWLLFAPILLWFLIMPALNAKLSSDQHAASLASGNATAQPMAATPLQALAAHASDTSWNPGELSRGHQNLVGGCKACHSQPFVHVKDEDCLACHKHAADHVSKKVAQVPALANVRCANCHIEHNGPMALSEQNHHYLMVECKSCHSNIKAAMPQTLTGNVSDFATGHPEFRVQVSTGLKRTDITRVRLDDTPALFEKTNLKFPHDVHLVPKGVKGPQGLVKMDCATCHKLDATGLEFKPITMAENCQSCHELRFEPADPTRTVPHGSVAKVLASLRDFYGYLGFNGVELNRPAAMDISRLPAGKSVQAATRITSPEQAQALANAAAKQLFEKTSCFSCHQVTPATPVDGQPNWSIAPIREQHPWMTKSLFRHDVHAMAACADCHGAKTSKSAHDVLMPGIKTCRTCHAGAVPETDKIVSNCNMCHGFHVTDHTMPANMPTRLQENGARIGAAKMSVSAADAGGMIK